MAHLKTLKTLHKNPSQSKVGKRARRVSAAKLQNDIYYQMASLFKAIHPDQGRQVAHCLVKKAVNAG